MNVDNQGVLAQLSQALAATVEAVGQSVVRVEGRRRGAASGIAWAEDGLVLTAHHSVQRDHDLRLGLPNGEGIDAELVGRDPSTDLALLRAPGGVLQPPAWANVDTLRVGHLVLSVGRPTAALQAGLGIVSALDQAWRTPAGGKVEAYLQTDVALYPGFSGSALVDAEGRVVGMNTSALMRGMSLTVPVATLREVVETLLAHGRVRRGYLGVGVQPAKLPPQAAEALGQKTGLLVVSIESDGSAAQGGLLVGDLIVALGGEPVRHLDDLMFLLGSDAIDATVSLNVVRGGTVTPLSVTVSERT